MNFNRLIRPIIDPGPVPIMFVIGVILLAVIGNGTYELIREYIGGGPLAIALAILLLLLMVMTYAAAIWLARRLRTVVTQEDAPPLEGLIVIVSHGKYETNAALTAVTHHKDRLKHCWLITTPEPDDKTIADTAWHNAQRLQQEFGAKFRVDAVTVHQFENWQDTFSAVKNCLDEARREGLGSDRLIADLTGGTKVMSVAMAMACNAANQPVEYLFPTRHLPDGRADTSAPARPRRINLAYKFALSD